MALQNLAHLGIGLAETTGTRETYIGENGDIAATSTELENLANAIWRRLMTPLGFYPEFPEYGSELHTLTGKGFLPEVLNLTEIFIRQSIMKEPRIEEIKTVTVTPTDYRSLTFYLALRPLETPSVYVMTFDYFLER